MAWRRPEPFSRPDFRAGDVVWIPRQSTPYTEDKARPFAFATERDPGHRATLCYGSTQSTEAAHGAAFARVMPQKHGLNRNGLERTTSFYPGILLRHRCDHLPLPAGRLGRDRPALTAALRTALGIGSGSCAAANAAPGSLRGRIVGLNARAAQAMRTPWAVILTEHRYSASRRYQVIVPLLGGSIDADARLTLRIRDRNWFPPFGEPVDSVVLPIPVTQSVWHPEQLVRETDSIIDPETLAEIDARLCSFFELDDP